MSLLKVYALIALVISSLFSAPSYGEDWQRVSVDSGLNKIYFDADSFELNEDGVAVWIMVDFATSVMGVLSRKSHVQMNCALGHSDLIVKYCMKKDLVRGSPTLQMLSRPS
jgi:hypothetical protein